MKISIKIGSIDTLVEAEHIIKGARTAHERVKGLAPSDTWSAPKEEARVLVGVGGGGGGAVARDLSDSAKPLIDKGKIAQMAAANPAKAPKEEKPKPAPRTKAAKAEEVEPADVEFEENEHGVLQPKGHAEKVEAAHGEDADDDIPFPEESQKQVSAKPTSNGKANGVNGAHKPAAKPASNLPKELVEARKLRDVLDYLMRVEKLEKDDVDGIKARCAAVKEQIPCLQRIGDLDSRIDRTLEVMDMGEDLT